MNKLQAIGALACALLVAGCGSMSKSSQSSSGDSYSSSRSTGQSSASQPATGAASTYTGELTAEQRRLMSGNWTPEQRGLYMGP